jgi:hypothetical protein
MKTYFQQSSAEDILESRKRVARHYDKYFSSQQDVVKFLQPSIAFFNTVEERDPAFNWSAVIATQKPSNYVTQFAKILKM